MELLLNLDMLIEELVSSRAQPSTVRPSTSSGVYAIYLRQGLDIPVIAPGPHGIIYVGEAGNLRQRVFDTHFADDQTGFSTLRRSLGALLKGDLNLTALPRSAGASKTNVQNYKFDPEGEKRLTVTRSTPRQTRRVANVWRRSWTHGETSTQRKVCVGGCGS